MRLLRELATSAQSATDGAAPEIAALADELAKHEGRAVHELAALVRSSWKRAAPSPRVRAPSAAPFEGRQWVDKIQASTTQHDVESVLKELATTKQLKAAEVAAIANAFRKTTTKYKSKAAAIDSIRDAWREARRDVGKASGASGVF